MLKLVFCQDGFNLCLEKGDGENNVKLTIYPDDLSTVTDNMNSVIVDRAELYRAIAFVMGDDIPKPIPPTPAPEPVPPIFIPDIPTPQPTSDQPIVAVPNASASDVAITSNAS